MRPAGMPLLGTKASFNSLGTGASAAFHAVIGQRPTAIGLRLIPAASHGSPQAHEIRRGFAPRGDGLCGRSGTLIEAAVGASCVGCGTTSEAAAPEWQDALPRALE